MIRGRAASHHLCSRAAFNNASSTRESSIKTALCDLEYVRTSVRGPRHCTKNLWAMQQASYHFLSLCLRATWFKGDREYRLEEV